MHTYRETLMNSLINNKYEPEKIPIVAKRLWVFILLNQKMWVRQILKTAVK